jgi:hypothetical protein
MTSGNWSATKWVEVKIDPRVAADGVTQADLEEQTSLGLKVRDAIMEARRLANRIREAQRAANDDPPRSARLAQILNRVVTAGGVYPQPMLIDQFSNIGRMIGQADQKVGKDAFVRYDDLMKEMSAIKAEFAKLTDR